MTRLPEDGRPFSLPGRIADFLTQPINRNRRAQWTARAALRNEYGAEDGGLYDIGWRARRSVYKRELSKAKALLGK